MEKVYVLCVLGGENLHFDLECAADDENSNYDKIDTDETAGAAEAKLMLMMLKMTEIKPMVALNVVYHHLR